MNFPTVAREPAWLMLDLGRRMTPAVAKRAFRRIFPRTMSAAFSEVYRRDVWQGGSGRGSTPENTLEYRDDEPRDQADVEAADRDQVSEAGVPQGSAHLRL